MNQAKKGTIISIKEIAKRSAQVTIKVPDDFSFRSGQYIWLMIPQLKYPDVKGNSRMFSIASSQNQRGQLDLIFRTSESGYKKTLMELTPGTEIIFSGPFGSLKLPQINLTPLVFLAGGVGVAPFLSMIRYSRESRSGHDITLIYANSGKEEAVYLDELSQIEKENPHFRLVTIFGQLEGGLLKQLKDGDANSKTIWHIIGSQGFVNSAGKFLNDAGISPNTIAFEEFYPELAIPSDFQQRLKTSSINKYPYFLAVESSSNHIVITDINGIILYANKAAENITGYTFEEMKGNTPRLWGGLMSGDFYKGLWQTIKYDRQAFRAEVINRRKNQDEYYALIRISPILDEQGNLTGFVATEEDITSLKQKEKELENAKTAARNVLEDSQADKEKIAQDKAKDEAILKNIGEGVLAIDLERKILFINQAGEDLLGWKSADITGRVINNLPLEDSEGRPILLEKRPTYIAMKEARNVISSDYLFVRNDKSKFSIYINVTPIILNGKTTGAIVVFRDISKEKSIDKAKTEFVSLASHQLRTPLSAMKWFCEMLLNGDAGELSPEQKEYTQNISDSNDMIIALVNALLNISRIEEGRLGVQPEPTDIKNLVFEVLGQLKKEADEKKQQFSVFINQNLPLINIDPKLIREVYINLFSNAIKYTPLGGKISIMVSVSPSELISRVSDSGIGIPKSQQGRVFKKFFRADNAVKLQSEGIGLGLYLAKAIIQSSGGKIWFESKENQGTSFIFSLPLNGSPAKKGEVTLNN